MTADFETTVDRNDCRVWAWSVCNIENPELLEYGNSMETFINYCQTGNKTLYFHNLKFDGEFILSYLLSHNFTLVHDRKKLFANSFTTLISDMGQFYTMEICFYKKGRTTKSVTIYDSLKILPFSVKEIAKGFGLPISKLEIDYKEKRAAGHELTIQEKDYITNDVRIVALALRTLFEQGLQQMTQGSNALFDYKKMITRKCFELWFPTPAYDWDIRQSYKGGFTYLKPEYRSKRVKNGMVFDVNSLYPSVMHNKPLPFGDGLPFVGQYEMDELYPLYVQQFTCNFELKPEHIPCIQLKNDNRFIDTEYLSSSDGNDITLTLTSVDMELFMQQYDVYNIDYLAGWKFKAHTGLFTEYIDKWSEVKIESKKNGNKAMYKLAKLMLNALYGKFATNPIVQSKYPYMDDNGIVKYQLSEKEERKPLYIPVGTFITAWARWTTINAAQSVYNRFVYADTDSIHILGDEIPKNIEIDDTKLGAWKFESAFDEAVFIRQKCYMEHGGDPKEPASSYEWKVTCAGMPDACKDKVTPDNFHTGSTFGGKLMPEHVKGGIVLKDIDFTIKR